MAGVALNNPAVFAEQTDQTQRTTVTAQEGTYSQKLHPIQRPDRNMPLDAHSGGSLWLASLAVGVILAAVGVYTWILKQNPGSRTQTTSLQVIARQPLGPRHSIYTVRIGSRILLVGTGTQGPPSLLTELDDWLDEPLVPSQKQTVERLPVASVRLEPRTRIASPVGGA